MDWESSFDGYLEHLCEALQHNDRNAGLIGYCQGLMLPLRRKSVEPLQQLRVADLLLDPATRQVKRAGSSISLTRTEFLLLDALMRNAGRVVTRSRLIESVWGYERDVEDNTLDVYIRLLRTKIDSSGSRGLIHTVRGVGYAMREEEIG